MRYAVSNLPPASQQWGRWLESTTDDVERLISNQTGDANSAGSQMSASLDNLARQINGLRTFTMTQTRVPDFSQFVNSIPVGAPPVFIYSPAITVNPPTQNANECRFIVNFDVYDDHPIGFVNDGFLFLRANQAYARDPRPSGQAAGGVGSPVPYNGARSSMMISSISGPVTLQFAMRLTPYARSGTATFSNITFTTVFSGSL